MPIPFHKPSVTDLESQYVGEALRGNLSGDGVFTLKVREIFQEKTGVENLILTTSGTHSLELAALLCDLSPGDEVILPSFTFSSTANAFLLRGASLRFCEIDVRTMNMDPGDVKRLISPKTKVIVPVHYAGVPCAMDEIHDIAKGCGALIVEDAAQAVGSAYQGKPAGTLSDVGCYSFHATKNYSMGEGGGLVVPSPSLREKAEMIREKGTDRSLFLRGQVDKYTWREMGSSYLPSDVLAAVLYAQLERFEEIMTKRMVAWNSYHEAFADLERQGSLIRQYIPPSVRHNAHMYYILLPDREKRDALMRDLNEKGISAYSHYEPLHSSPMGLKLGYKPDDLPITLEYAGRLVRLPLFADMTRAIVNQVVEAVEGFFR